MLSNRQDVVCLKIVRHLPLSFLFMFMAVGEDEAGFQG